MHFEYYFHKSNKQDTSELDYIILWITHRSFIIILIDFFFFIHITQLTGYDMTWITKIHAMNDMQFMEV